MKTMTLALVWACVSASVLSQAAIGAVIYRQDFDSSATSGNTNITAGTTWRMQRGSGTVPIDVTPTAVGNYFGGISVDAAAPSNGGNTDGTNGTIAAPAQGSTAGRIFFNTGNTGLFNAVVYTETVVDPELFTVTGVSWWARNSSGGVVGGSRAALKVDGQWYAGSTLNNAGAWTQASITLAGETWTPFNFVPDTQLLAISGTAGALPAGTIQAFGLYLQAGTTDGSLTRADGFTLTGTAIAVVPEPGAVGVIGAVGAMLVRRRQE